MEFSLNDNESVIFTKQEIEEVYNNLYSKIHTWIDSYQSTNFYYTLNEHLKYVYNKQDLESFNPWDVEAIRLLQKKGIAISSILVDKANQVHKKYEDSNKKYEKIYEDVINFFKTSLNAIKISDLADVINESFIRDKTIEQQQFYLRLLSICCDCCFKDEILKCNLTLKQQTLKRLCCNIILGNEQTRRKLEDRCKLAVQMLKKLLLPSQTG